MQIFSDLHDEGKYIEKVSKGVSVRKIFKSVTL